MTTPAGPYLAFVKTPGTSSLGRLLAIESDASALVNHLHDDGLSLGRVQVYDTHGRGLRIDKGGVRLTGITVSEAAAAKQIGMTFRAARKDAERNLLPLTWDKGAGGPVPSQLRSCAVIKKFVVGVLSPTTADIGGKPLPLGEVARDTSWRLDLMHDPTPLPHECVRPDDFVRNHKGRFLHNLWHRITGTS